MSFHVKVKNEWKLEVKGRLVERMALEEEGEEGDRGRSREL